MEQFHGTTILTVRRGNVVALGGDGQVTLGNIVMKGTARKVRKLYHNKVLAGFAGGTADAFIPGTGEYVEIKGARAKSRGSRVQGPNARPQFQIC